MRIAPDTNILVRAVTEDHVHQSRAAQTALKKAVKLLEAQGGSARLLA
jgi:predicted nucleic-acid-binding protein